ncbi:glycosyltransferase family 2 protein [Lusitaniella coriacea]|uniref:glycosyltransferase family 2 protein n=1 Tax=Lusitaniella coriacea TaxID=1983105 RepID=UPI003CEC4ACD
MAILSTAVTLKDLPPPPSGKEGWPWTEETKRCNTLPNYPRISVVTPSYNQDAFIEETIRSVLLQGYPNLEYIIIDGGSSDDTLAILRKYEPFLANWISERDRGQSDALNKGFRRATGKLIGWQNSDDSYQPNSFLSAANCLNQNPDADVVYGNINFVDEQGQIIEPYPITEAKPENMMPYSGICNHSVFYTNRIFEENNYIDDTLKHCMDQEFILRLLIKNYKFVFEPGITANWRIHNSTKSAQQMDIWAEEAFELCKSVYRDRTLSATVREKAKESLYGLCLDNFGKLRLNLFRKTVREMVDTLGWKSLNTEFALKYIVSLFGVQTLTRLKRTKRQFINN